MVKKKDMCTSVFIEALFTIAKTSKQPKCPLTDEWIKKMWYMYTREYYSATKNKKKQTKKIIVIRIFSWGLLCQCPCSPSEPEPVPTSPGGLPVLLGQSLDLLWTLWGQLRP